MDDRPRGQGMPAGYPLTPLSKYAREMSDKKKILIQLDSDAHPSVFDRVVAVDAGAEEIFSYGNVQLDQVRDLVYGAIFTRGPSDLHRSAVFIGGSDLEVGEKMLDRVTKSFLGALSVSVLLDSSGANTTASAAVRVAASHVDLAGAQVLVLGATGLVGRRVVRLLAHEGARVRVGSRSLDRSTEVVQTLRELGTEKSLAALEEAELTPVATGDDAGLKEALDGVSVVICAGAIGVTLLPEPAWRACSDLRVIVDLNAVPPLGAEGVEVTAKAVDEDGVLCYGAVGVGGTKMKIHKAAVRALFEKNDQVLDAEAVYELGRDV